MTGIEPLLQYLRIRQVLPYIQQKKVLVDLGCDAEMTLIKKLASQMKQVVGLDLVATDYKQGNFRTIKADITKKLPLPANSADVVTLLAVLEHLPNPQAVLKEVCRILKPGGILLVTVPAPQVKWLLESILAPIGLVRSEMIDQHQNYFTADQLSTLAKKAGLTDVRVTKFELGFNTFLQAKKSK